MVETDLTKKVTDWLESQGYPAEMRTASAFRRAHFTVVQSDYYEDPTSHEQREIDVVAHLQEESVENTTLRLTVVVECKLSRDKPWILFAARTRIHPRASIAQRTGSSIGGAFLRIVSSDEDVQELPLFKLPEKTAYGVTQAFTSGKDIAYAACVASASASVAVAHEVDGASTTSLKRQARIVIPVVAVDGRLFEASLSSDEELAVQEIDRAVLAWRNPIGSVAHTFVHFVSLAAIDEFVTNVEATARGLFGKGTALSEARARAR